MPRISLRDASHTPLISPYHGETMSLNEADVEGAAMTWLGELGYSSNLQDEAVKTVPQQAELLCEDWMDEVVQVSRHRDCEVTGVLSLPILIHFLMFHGGTGDGGHKLLEFALFIILRGDVEHEFHDRARP